MRKLEDIRREVLGKEILTTAETTKIKGGTLLDEIRRPRPGGGISTHSGTVPSSKI